MQQRSATQWLFAAYYAATFGFALLDYRFAFNVRLSFLDAWPSWPAAYYVFCVACFLIPGSVAYLALMLHSRAARQALIGGRGDGHF